MAHLHQRAWLGWASVSLLGLFCTVLAVLQYRWTGEISAAERSRLQDALHNQLNALSRRFNTTISNGCRALFPSDAQIEQVGREAAYSAQYLRWTDSHDRLFSRIGLAIPEDGRVRFLMMNLDTARFVPSDWPREWARTRDHLALTVEGRLGPPPVQYGTLVVLPRFDSPHDDRRSHEQEWLLLELNTGYLRDTLLPELLNRYLGQAGRIDYDAEVIENGHQSATNTTADARVSLLDVRMMGFGGPRGQDRSGGPPPGPYGQQGDELRRERPEGVDTVARAGEPGPPDAGHGYWTLLVRRRAGSLDALVARTRWRNLMLSAGMLLLILATATVLVRFSRREQQLAQLQMNFVAGVSHELRTPLTVIRTAGFNLQGRLANRPDQVERYGALIQAESEKLAALVEQVLRFASAKAGHVIREREPVAIEVLIEEGLRSSRAGFQAARVVLEKHLDPGLPLVLADQTAMQQALRNLVDNALKYGTEGGNWIGVFASSVDSESGPAVEIRVADHGPGIPADEQKRIFDPFFRGRRAVDDQVHGTGLGLNLVKRIIEAHGGTIQVKSEPMQGTEFVIRIPAAEPAMNLV